MTATEELRRLLDERGVEHTDFGGMTEWANEYRRICRAYTRPEPLTVDVAVLAVPPEQAIAATLVAERTCHDLGGTDENGEQVFDCSECGCVLSLYDRDGSNTLCTSFIYDYPRYCPECGAKVVD